MLDIIMIGTNYFTLVLMYLMVRFMATDDKYCFGVKVNSKMLAHEGYKEYLQKTKKKFNKELRNWFLINAIITLCSLAIPYVSIRIMIATIWLFIIIIVMCIPYVHAFEEMNKWKIDEGIALESDGDQYWKWGVFYCNPEDKRSAVEKRFGIGETSNMATKSGKIGGIAIIVTIVATFGVLVWLVAEEFIPIHLQIHDEQVVAKQIGGVLKIDLDDIEDVQLLKKIPKMSKSNGTSMDTLLKGEFYVPDEHRGCEVFCNPKNNLLIRIQVDDELYLLGGYDDAETKEIYDKLK